MSDIVENLRNPGLRSEWELHEDRDEAADEIERLRAELEAERARVAELSEAIEYMLDPEYLMALGSSEDGDQSCVHSVQEQAQAALSRTPAQTRAEIEARVLEEFADDMDKAANDADGSSYDLGSSSIIVAARERASRIRSEAKENGDAG